MVLIIRLVAKSSVKHSVARRIAKSHVVLPLAGSLVASSVLVASMLAATSSELLARTRIIANVGK